MHAAGIAVCLGVILARAKRHVQPAEGHRRTDVDFGTQSMAYAVAQRQLAFYRLLELQGHLKMIGTVRELDAYWQIVLNGYEVREIDAAFCGSTGITSG
jgi:membrane dipeptidase